MYLETRYTNILASASPFEKTLTIGFQFIKKEDEEKEEEKEETLQKLLIKILVFRIRKRL